MRSQGRQLDIFDNDPRMKAPRLAQAYRDAADEALKQFQFSASVRQERHDHYLAEAIRIEADATQNKRAEGRRRRRTKGVG